MYKRIAICLMISMTGCASTPKPPTNGGIVSAQEPQNDGIANVGNSIRNSWSRITDGVSKRDKPVQTWQWQSGIPSVAQRAELVSTMIPSKAITHFVPQMNIGQIQLVSGPNEVADWQLVTVGGQPVRNLAELDFLVERVVEANEHVLIEVQDAQSVSNPIEVAPATLVALCQTAGGGSNVTRLVEGGKPSILIREDGVRCKMTVRTERESGIVQLIISVRNCWGPQKLLPLEVRAGVNGQPLRCLTVAESLERLHGDRRLAKVDELAGSFAAVSEREDYLIPTNYRKLQQIETEKIPVNSLRVRPQPALLLAAGQAYPGPAVLGDARALSEFLLQRQLYHTDDPDRTGWIMFAGEAAAIRKGGTIDVEVDLGYGLKRYQFLLPANG